MALDGNELTSVSNVQRPALILDAQVPLIGVGGIGTGKDAYEKIRAGASLVQVLYYCSMFRFCFRLCVWFCLSSCLLCAVLVLPYPTACLTRRPQSSRQYGAFYVVCSVRPPLWMC